MLGGRYQGVINVLSGGGAISAVVRIGVVIHAIGDDNCSGGESFKLTNSYQK